MATEQAETPLQRRGRPRAHTGDEGAGAPWGDWHQAPRWKPSRGQTRLGLRGVSRQGLRRGRRARTPTAAEPRTPRG